MRGSRTVSKYINPKCLVPLIGSVALILFSSSAQAQETTFLDFGTIQSALSGTKETTLGISQLFLLPLFAFYMIHQQLKLNPEQQNYAQGLIQLVLIFVALATYDPFFSSCSVLFRNISEQIFSPADFDSFKDALSNMTPTTEQGGMAQFWGIIRFQAMGILAYLSFWFVTIASYFLILLRNVMLGFLYVIGPIWLAVSLLPEKQGALYRFFEQVVMVNGWTIVSNIIFKIMFVAFYQETHNVENHFVEIIAANIALGTLILSTPKLTAKLAEGAGIGSVNALPALQSQVTKVGMLAAGIGMRGWQSGVSRFGGAGAASMMSSVLPIKPAVKPVSAVNSVSRK
jgi:hypothetical protein